MSCVTYFKDTKSQIKVRQKYNEGITYLFKLVLKLTL